MQTIGACRKISTTYQLSAINFFVVFRMQRLFVFFLFSFVFLQADAQADYLTLKDFPVTEGKILVAHYDDNIYKIVYQPADYQPKELVSDAVILRRQTRTGHR